MYEDQDVTKSVERPCASALTTARIGVTINSSNKVAAASAGAAIDGILVSTNDAADGSVAVVPVNGCLPILVLAGGTCTAGSSAAVATSGFENAAGADVVVGKFLTGGSEGDQVLLLPYNRSAETPVDPSAFIADATAITGGESPTEAEHNALVTKINAILDVLVEQGLMDAS
jgi:hypothetical protein